MPSADQLSAARRADEFRRADAKLRVIADLMSYLSLEEACIVTNEIHQQLMLDLGRQEARLQWATTRACSR
jgi:hypothetical protein